MKAKQQRLILALLGVAAVVAAALLAMSALKDQAAYFYSPGDVARQKPPVDTPMRLGGMVATGSLQRAADGVTITFRVEEGAASVRVRFKGIAPDLFKEGSGVVAEGELRADGTFEANNLLAKHDERYMPPELAGKMHKTETLKP